MSPVHRAIIVLFKSCRTWFYNQPFLLYFNTFVHLKGYCCNFDNYLPSYWVVLDMTWYDLIIMFVRFLKTSFLSSWYDHSFLLPVASFNRIGPFWPAHPSGSQRLKLHKFQDFAGSVMVMPQWWQHYRLQGGNRWGEGRGAHFTVILLWIIVS